MKRTIRMLALMALAALCAQPLGAQAPAASPTTATAAAPAPAAATPKEDTAPMTLNPRVKMSTTLGDIVVELNGEKAPATVLNFAKYVQDGYYAGTIFHRVMSTFMIQGGGFLPSMDEKQQGLRTGVVNEWQNGLRNAVGTIAMARIGGQPDSGRAQFFINVVNNANLDTPQGDGAGYAVFGKVVEGMDVVEKIRNTPVASHPKYPMGAVVPTTPVVISEMKMLDQPDIEKMTSQVAKAAKAAAGDVDGVVAQYEADGKTKFQTTASGLRYAVLTAGAGASPKPTDTVEVHYRGTLLNGSEFDSSRKHGGPISFPLNGVIKGWTEGVGLMKVGGKSVLICPANLAYGARALPGIPGNSTLVFEVELLAIK